jgi:hypothetical protein
MSKSDWEQRFREATDAWQHLKSLTKRVPANQWTPEYRELAGYIHTKGREVFYVNLDDYNEPQGKT